MYIWVFHSSCFWAKEIKTLWQERPSVSDNSTATLSPDTWNVRNVKTLAFINLGSRGRKGNDIFNIISNVLFAVPATDLKPAEKPSKEQINLALSVAKTSTASVGKFTKALPKESEVKKPKGKKRKVCNTSLPSFCDCSHISKCISEDKKVILDYRFVESFSVFVTDISRFTKCWSTLCPPRSSLIRFETPNAKRRVIMNQTWSSVHPTYSIQD